MTGQRILIAVLTIPVVAVATWLGQVPFAILIFTACLLGLLEFFDLAQQMGFAPRRWVGCLLGLSLLGSVWLSRSGAMEVPPLFTATVLGLFLWEVLRAELRVAVPSVAVTLLGILYLPWLLSYLLLLRDRPDGLGWVAFVFACVWAMDSAAYFFGLAFGRHKLSPSISPHKSWEGAVASFICAVLVGVLFSAARWIPASAGRLAAVAAGMNVLGQFGDLAESMLKRSAGVKDSGRLLPGHGGILDKLDAILFAAPVCYYGLQWIR